MSNSYEEYWRLRERANLLRVQEEEKQYDKKIQSTYSKMIRDIQLEIDSFYIKYADDNGLSLSQVRKKVSKLDMDRYSKLAKKFVDERNFTEIANEQMKIYNLTMKINRLEMLKSYIGQHLVGGFFDIENDMRDILISRTVSEFERQAGILGATVPENINEVAKQIVEGSHKVGVFTDDNGYARTPFSSFIWSNYSDLKGNIDSLLLKGITLGKNPKVLAMELEKIGGASKKNCERLMRTELAKVQVQANAYQMNKLDYKCYIFINTEDKKTCSICSAFNSDNPILLKELQIGKNAPPMHPNCRCAIAPYEMEKEKEHSEAYKYLKLPSNADTMKIGNHELTETTQKVINRLQEAGIEYRKVEPHSEFMTEERIIKVLGGGDKTKGSCASLAMAYLGQKKGLNVLDFRGGKSMEFFANPLNEKLFFSQFTDIYHSVMAKNTARAGTEALKLVESGKEYLLSVGRHMAVVRRTDEGVLQYLELQSEHYNGWHDFASNPRHTLIDRFVCSGTGWRGLEVFEAQLTNIDDFDSVYDLKEVLGYINTASDKQKKGDGGHEK